MSNFVTKFKKYKDKKISRIKNLEDSESTWKNIVVQSVLGSLILIFIGFGINDYFVKSELIGIIELTLGIITIFVSIYFINSHNLYLTNFVMICLVFPFAIYNGVFEGKETGLFWFYSFPIYFMFLYGAKKGTDRKSVV